MYWSYRNVVSFDSVMARWCNPYHSNTQFERTCVEGPVGGTRATDKAAVALADVADKPLAAEIEHLPLLVEKGPVTSL